MSLAATDAPRILELLQAQPNGRLETRRIDHALEIPKHRRVRALRELAAAGHIRRLLEPGTNGIQGGVRITQAVEAFCGACNGHGDYDVVGPNTKAVSVEVCPTCKGQGLLPTSA